MYISAGQVIITIDKTTTIRLFDNIAPTESEDYVQIEEYHVLSN